MKITSFNPLILTKDADSKIRLFEEMGFEKRHSITIDESGTDITTVRMKRYWFSRLYCTFRIADIRKGAL